MILLARAALWRLFLMVVLTGAFSSTVRAQSAGTENADIKRIIANCRTSVSSCMNQFSLYSRADNETNINGSVSILTFWKTSSQIFSGYAEELYYTEIDLHGIQYQLGYGYVVSARQQDAKPSGSGSISSVAVAGNAEIGFTKFAASIIGIVPDQPPVAPSTCKSPGLPGGQALLCAVDLQPTVTQDYFKAELGRLSTAFVNWAQHPPSNTGAESAICPQIINYRTKDRTRVGAEVNLTAEQANDINDISAQLSAMCHNKRPNLHLSYKNGRPTQVNSVDVNIAGADNKASHSELSQGYYRNKMYLADTALRKTSYYDPSDHFAEIYVDGLNAAASLPSLLAALVTLNATIQNQRIHAYTQCSAGANAITLTAFSGIIADPLAVATAYGDFVNGMRAAADADQSRCA